MKEAIFFCFFFFFLGGRGKENERLSLRLLGEKEGEMAEGLEMQPPQRRPKFVEVSGQCMKIIAFLGCGDGEMRHPRLQPLQCKVGISAILIW